MSLKLFPAPRKVVVEDTTIDLSGAAWIVFPPSASKALRSRVTEAARAMGTALNDTLRVSAAVPQVGQVLLRIDVDAKHAPAQGFRLCVGEGGGVLQAGDEAGAFYGVQSFTQLIQQFGARLPILSISDSPDFPARGVMLDVSRCKVPTLATLKLLIDRLAGMRLNEIQLYIEHTFAFSAHEKVWHDASPFTHEEILVLDQYCQDRFVALVPNLNSFGHVERWLRHPEYKHLAECPEGFDRRWGGHSPWGSTLTPNRESLRFIAGLYDEYLPLFSNTLFNVGCDETWELGTGRSKKKADARGTTVIYLEFLKKIHKLCVRHGRRMQFWGDIILHQPELIKELPKDCIALNWGYEANHPYPKESKAFAEAGIDFYVCPGTSSWNSITGRTDNCLGNLESAAANGLRHGAIGYLNTDWGDGGHHQVLPISYVGYAAGAAYSWCLASNRDVDLAGALNRHFFQDETGTLGQLCLDLGRTLNRIPGATPGNASIINHLLFWDLNPEHLDLSTVTVAQLRKAEAWLDRLAHHLTRARPQASDADLVMCEMTHAINASRHAVHRGLAVKTGGEDATALRSELQHIIMTHEEQWLARNRRGGLHESSDRLRNALVPLSDL